MRDFCHPTPLLVLPYFELHSVVHDLRVVSANNLEESEVRDEVNPVNSGNLETRQPQLTCCSVLRDPRTREHLINLCPDRNHGIGDGYFKIINIWPLYSEGI